LPPPPVPSNGPYPLRSDFVASPDCVVSVTAYSYAFGAFVLGGAAGVFLMAAGFDSTHSYTLPLGAFFFAMLIAAGLMSRLGPYRYAARRAEPAPGVANAGAAIQA